MYSNEKDPCLSEHAIAAKFKKLKSFIAHAQEVAQDTEAVVRSLREQNIDPTTYSLTSDLAVNLRHLQELVGNSDDVQIREFFLAALKRKAALVFIEGMIDKELLNRHVIEKLMIMVPNAPYVSDELTYLKNTLLGVVSFSEVFQIEEAVEAVLSGETILLVEGISALVRIDSRKLEYRAISESPTESSLQAARDAFIESLSINITLLRRRIKDPNLIVKKFTLGARSKTAVAIVFIQGIANPGLSLEVERRLTKINVEAFANIGLLQGLMEDHPYSLFPTMLSTERPDKTVAALVEGKVAILMDTSPFALLAPAVFSDFFQVSDDYSEKWAVASLIRFTRYVSALIAVATPALFVAITTFHPGLLPTPLTVTIATARQGIPFPALLEALIMEAFLEILQEAGVRLPKPIGPAVSIVGGLVIGEATVRAGFISAPMVIVIALTAIASFNIANYRINLIVRLCRVPLMLLSSALGMVGVMLGLLAIVGHLSVLESFGVAYLGPLIPKNTGSLSDSKDALVVAPPLKMGERPDYLQSVDGKQLPDNGGQN
ncbi:Spore germination protein B1 [Sporomusa ovata DSM 2662]|uniref:Spore germination protein GerKA n=1 Tax=Sporomusa ovata TaxID=2378 RepID=A0A0U1L1Q1_9FIRM|nr:spore germination protein [Sporomusa ovata]EQB25042.1 spore germination protein A1 [Sporomusa ovata DSM 2662]CQR73592.1 Spore germination protein GerKA [Sporomusa ovata]